jgi:signal transduction histidine kinase
MMHDITERKEAERSLQQLSSRMLGLQDEERRRIARQLHDTTAQNLAALKLNLGRISRTVVNTPIQDAIDESIALTDESISEVRTLSYLLHPPLIDDAGLITTLRWFVRGFETRSGISVGLDVPDDLQRFPRDVETALFRIVQETLTNIQRHSGSSLARIRLDSDIRGIHLEIADEGTGAPPHLRGNLEALIASGVGLGGIRQRVRDLGGEMQFESNSSGTKVIVDLPAEKT